MAANAYAPARSSPLKASATATTNLEAKMIVSTQQQHAENINGVVAGTGQSLWV